MIVAWFLFVLRYQYRVAWLRPYEIELDLLFLGAVAAVAITRLFRSGAARARGVLLRVALAVTMTALALVACEGVVRFAYRHVRSSGDATDFVGRRDLAPKRKNSLGFREREIPPRTPGKYRIAVVGDSFTYGSGLEENERLSNQLEARLGPRYEVFNFGRPGNDMVDHLVVLEKVRTISPDFVVLQLFINDFEVSYKARPVPYPLLPRTADHRLQASSLMYGLAKRGWDRLQEVLGIVETYDQYMRRHLADPRSPDSTLTTARMLTFFERARAAGIGVGVMMFPATDAMGAHGSGYPYGYLHDRARSVCAGAQVPYADLLPLFSSARDPRVWSVSPLDAHPNAAANGRAVGEVLNVFGPVWSTR